MMKNILIIFLLLHLNTGFSQKKSTSSVKQQMKDFSIFKNEILANSAGLYFYNTEEEFNNQLDSLELGLQIPRNI